jgi:hypothetical protein
MEAMQAMTPEENRQVIQGGRWVNIATDLRPGSNKSASHNRFVCSLSSQVPGTVVRARKSSVSALKKRKNRRFHLWEAVLVLRAKGEHT